MARNIFDEEPEEIEILDEPVDIGLKGVRIMFVYNDSVIRKLFVIVERWNHRLSGKCKREYHKQFTEKERKKIAQVQTKLHRWYLVTGIPANGVTFHPGTMKLMIRAANFFAS